VVGTFGNALDRFAEQTASARSLPSLISPIADGMPMQAKSTRPVITSVTASTPPLNGTWVALKPALTRSRSAAQCVALPTPAEAKVIFPDFAAATNSPRVLMPFEGAIMTTLAALPNGMTAEKSRVTS
jgi:hypothetical protein